VTNGVANERLAYLHDIHTYKSTLRSYDGMTALAYRDLHVKTSFVYRTKQLVLWYEIYNNYLAVTSITVWFPQIADGYKPAKLQHFKHTLFSHKINLQETIKS